MKLSLGVHTFRHLVKLIASHRLHSVIIVAASLAIVVGTWWALSTDGTNTRHIGLVDNVSHSVSISKTSSKHGNQNTAPAATTTAPGKIGSGTVVTSSNSSKGTASTTTKKTLPLTISPSTVTIYKNTAGAQGIKAGITSTNLQISSSDGKVITSPTSAPSANMFLIASDFTSRPSWTQSINTQYASVGTYNVAVTATSADGTTNYSGTLHVTVLPLPTFAVSIGVTTQGISPGDANFALRNYVYSDNFGGAYSPNISITSLGSTTFTITGINNGSIYFYSSQPITYLPVTTYIVFENQFQKISIPIPML